jgi:hypothetical protein
MLKSYLLEKSFLKSAKPLKGLGLQSFFSLLDPPEADKRFLTKSYNHKEEAYSKFQKLSNNFKNKQTSVLGLSKIINILQQAPKKKSYVLTLHKSNTKPTYSRLELKNKKYASPATNYGRNCNFFKVEKYRLVQTILLSCFIIYPPQANKISQETNDTLKPEFNNLLTYNQKSYLPSVNNNWAEQKFSGFARSLLKTKQKPKTFLSYWLFPVMGFFLVASGKAVSNSFDIPEAGKQAGKEEVNFYSYTAPSSQIWASEKQPSIYYKVGQAPVGAWQSIKSLYPPFKIFSDGKSRGLIPAKARYAIRLGRAKNFNKAEETFPDNKKSAAGADFFLNPNYLPNTKSFNFIPFINISRFQFWKSAGDGFPDLKKQTSFSQKPILKCQAPLGAWLTSKKNNPPNAGTLTSSYFSNSNRKLALSKQELSKKKTIAFATFQPYLKLKTSIGGEISSANFFESKILSTPVLNYKQASFFLNFLIQKLKSYPADITKSLYYCYPPQGYLPTADTKPQETTLNTLSVKFLENGNGKSFLNKKTLLYPQFINGSMDNKPSPYRLLNSTALGSNKAQKYTRAYNSIYESTFNYLTLISSPTEAKIYGLNKNCQDPEGSWPEAHKQEMCSNKIENLMIASSDAIDTKPSFKAFGHHLYLGKITKRLPIVTGGFFTNKPLAIDSAYAKPLSGLGLQKSKSAVDQGPWLKLSSSLLFLRPPALTPTKLSGGTPNLIPSTIKSLKSNRNLANTPVLKNLTPPEPDNTKRLIPNDLPCYFYNYLKHIRLKISLILPINGPLAYKNLLQNYLPDRPYKAKSSQEPLEPWLVKTYLTPIKDLNSNPEKVKYQPEAISRKEDNKSPEDNKSKLSVYLPNNFSKTFYSQNSLPTVLLHKKFLLTLKLGKPNFYPPEAEIPAYLLNKKEIVYVESQKNLHKKAKAKRQRLESRQQKKRKRFYPRPNWLRLRLCVNFYKKTSPYRVIKMAYTNVTSSSAEPTLRPLVLKPWLLNNYIQSLSNRRFILRPEAFIQLLDKKAKTLKGLDILMHRRVNKATSQNKLVLNLKNLAYTLIDNSNNLGSYSNTHMTKYSKFANHKNYYKIIPPQADTKSPFKIFSLAKNFNKANKINKVITSIKNNASYAIFDNNPNNNQPKKETNNNLLRDFWVWLYNNTNTNSLNKKIVIDNILNHFSIPVNMFTDNKKRPAGGGDINSSKKLSYKSNSNSLKRSYWAFNKTNLIGAYPLTNKRTNIWSIQKLRNQSKNNKTKYLEKKIRKQLDLFLFPTLKKQAASKSWPIISKLDTSESSSKLRSEALLHFLAKLKNVNSGLNSFYGVQSLKLIKSYKSNISHKIHKKEKKLSYLAIHEPMFTNISNKTTLNSKIHRSETLLAGPISTFVSWPKITTNFNWWSSFNNLEQSAKPLKGLGLQLWAPPMSVFLKPEFKVNRQAPKGAWPTLTALNINNLPLANNNKISQGQNPLSNVSAEPLAFVLGLHFCALISLISISQVRCFIKFHLILLQKLSNIYLQIIYTNLKLTTQSQAFFKEKGLIKNKKSDRRPLIGSADSKKELTKKAIGYGPSHLSADNVGNFSPKMPSPFRGLAYFGFSRKKAKKPNSIYNILKRYSTKNAKPLKGLGLQMPFFLKVGQGVGQASQGLVNWQLFLQNVDQASEKNNKGKKNLGKNFLNKPYYKTVSFHYNKTYSYRKILDSDLFINNYSNSQDPEGSWPAAAFWSYNSSLNTFSPSAKTLQGLDNFNNGFINKKSWALKVKFLAKPLSGLLWGSYQKRAINRKIDPPPAGKGQDPTGAWLIAAKPITQLELIKKYLYIKRFSKFATEPIYIFTTNTTTQIKKEVINTVFKIIDTFEYFLRLIYGFFEKPTELTMDWVAYAFLVEWSSDLITFTPENKEKKNWLVFARITRQSKILFLPFFSNFIQLSSQMIIGQLLYKRLLFLNDLFIDILNRPDTDLINRQQKGTLFWDIWSDVLIKAADNYNINIPSLSNIKDEQNNLIDRFLSNPPDTSSAGMHESPRKVGQGPYYPRGGEVSIHLVKSSGSTKGQRGSVLTLVSRLSPLKDRHSNAFLPSSSHKLSAPGGAAKPLSGLGLQELGLTSLTGQFNNTFPPVADYSSRIANTAGFEYVTYQSKETELFLDYHPPKSFNHVSAIQYYSIVQQPIGNLVCQIYSGILTKQISKNVLVIGSTLSSNTDTIFDRMQKTLLIQALAGETEIKIITDNASRYAVVNRGFAVGIKILKEVFEAIALNTPCLFLLEDIHLIGERRPLLISDHGDALGDENKSVETTFGSQSNGEAVHEKNQIYYQLSRHGITHYKKPFKGDFSLSIPTNHFSFDLFCSVNFSKRYSNYASTPTNPLSSGLNSTEANSSVTTDAQTHSKGPEALLSSIQKMSSKRKVSSVTGSNKILSSYLQIGRNQQLSPPSTSPFSVFLLKEQKQFKPKKIVKELPWIGLPSEQLSILPRVSYSVRAKVAALADLGLSSMSAKLDMITDLLVIIDSVRGNRGFVVFATTHLPHILDPALRRPGRLDETISLPTLTNLWNRWEFTKANKPIIYNTGFAYPPVANHNFFISLFGFWPTYLPPADKKFTTNTIIGYHGTLDYLDFLNYDLIPNQKTNVISPIISNLAKAKFKSFARIGEFNKKRLTRQRSLFSIWPGLTKSKVSTGFSPTKVDTKVIPTRLQLKNRGIAAKATSIKSANYVNKIQEANLITLKKLGLDYKSTNISYFQMGKKIILFYCQDPEGSWPEANRPVAEENSWLIAQKKLGQSTKEAWYFNPIYNNFKTFDSTSSLTESSSFLFNELQYKSLYASTNMIQKTLLDLLSGKLSELFAFKTIPLMSTAGKRNTQISGQLTNLNALGNPTSNMPSPDRGLAFMPKGLKYALTTKGNHFRGIKNFICLYGIDQTWRAATSLALSFVKKRYLYNKNLIVPKLLNFLDYSVIDEPPSPPSGKSNILIPAKRFENYKKVYKENIEKKAYSSFIQEKLESHSKQSYIKSIYNKSAKPLKGLGLQKVLPNINLAYKEIGSFVCQSPTGAWQINNSPLAQPTSFNWYYQNKILKRHSNYLTNQWWNGQLTEHSAESLFLSDIDWRLTFNTVGQVKSTLPLEATSYPPIADQTTNYTPEAYSGTVFGDRQKLFTQFVSKLKDSAFDGKKFLAEQNVFEILNKQQISQADIRLKPEALLNWPKSKVDFLENSFSCPPQGGFSPSPGDKQDILIDFPDADQLYNPKHRRWMLASGYNSSWFTFDKKIQTEIVEHLIIECFIQSFNILDQNRELLDYSATKYLKTGLIKEIHFLFLLTAGSFSAKGGYTIKKS